MTFHLRNLLALYKAHHGGDAKVPPALLLTSYPRWSAGARLAYDYLFGCHDNHITEYVVAFIHYFWLWPMTFPHAATFSLRWMLPIIAFNLVTMIGITSFWHFLMYQSPLAIGPVRTRKFNPANQYEPELSWTANSYTPVHPDAHGRVSVGAITCSTGQLQREILFSILGWLQSSLWQIVIMHAWAVGAVPHYDSFWAFPLYSILHLLLPTYWRLFHFYCVHRVMHPWWPGSKSPYDVGAFLYRHVHSLHHKSYNPGPWSGGSMHPVEHLFLYSCMFIAFIVPLHPLHMLYNKWHADISSIGGHDGFDAPGGGSTYHYLHHAHYECNYGVPLINLDKLFGTWVDYNDYVACGKNFPAAKEKSKARNGLWAILGVLSGENSKAPGEAAAGKVQ